MYLEPAAQTPESQTSVIRQPRPLPVEHVQLELTPDLKQAVPSQQTKKRFLLRSNTPRRAMSGRARIGMTGLIAA
jgi:hypothetical protein